MDSGFLKSFAYAFRGILHTFSQGRNFKVQCGFAIAAGLLGILLSISPLEWVAIVICMGVVLGGECMNTALETLVDLVSPDYNELAGRAKDCAAGAVLIGAIASLVIACIIFLPKLIALIR